MLFGLYAVVHPRNPETAPRRIEVTAGQIETLKETWKRQWFRPPTSEELKGLVDAYIYEEVLKREAIALGLDRDDPVIRRRLVQKYEFLTEDLDSGTYETRQKAKEESFKRLMSRYEIVVDKPAIPFDIIRPAAVEERES